jgi:tRNA-binding protein
MIKPLVTYNDFDQLDIRVGTIVEAHPFPKARKPAYQLHIDFGDLGIKKTSAQITDHYTPQDLIGQQVVAVVNFPVKQIANFFSECLILGAVEANGVKLLTTSIKTSNGTPVS